MPSFDDPPPYDPDSLAQSPELETIGEPIPLKDWLSVGSVLDPEAIRALAESHNMNPDAFRGILLDPRTLLYKSKSPVHRVVHIPAKVLGTNEPSDFAVPVEYFPQ